MSAKPQPHALHACNHWLHDAIIAFQMHGNHSCIQSFPPKWCNTSTHDATFLIDYENKWQQPAKLVGSKWSCCAAATIYPNMLLSLHLQPLHATQRTTWYLLSVGVRFLLKNASKCPPCASSPPTATIEASIVMPKRCSKSDNAKTGADVNLALPNFE